MKYSKNVCILLWSKLILIIPVNWYSKKISTDSQMSKIKNPDEIEVLLEEI